MELLSGGGIGGKTYNPPALDHYDIACLLFHNSSNRIVLTVIRRIVNQANFQHCDLAELSNAFDELGAITSDSRTII
jgi:hypothetical protein